jgi:hypothetical protein
MQSYELHHSILNTALNPYWYSGETLILLRRERNMIRLQSRFCFKSEHVFVGHTYWVNKVYFLHEYLFSLLPAEISFSTSTSHITHQTSDIKHPSPNTGHQTPNIRHPTSDTQHPSSHIPYFPLHQLHRFRVPKNWFLLGNTQIAG